MKKIKNSLIILLTRFIQCLVKKSKSTGHQKILIVSTTGLGDTVWASPAIRAIKQSLPQAKLSLLTTGLGKETLLHNPHIEETHVTTYQPLLQLWKELKAESFDTVLIFHASQRFIFPLVTSIGAHTTVSTQGLNKGLDSLLTHPVPARKAHEIDRRMDIAKIIGVSPTCGPLEIPSTADEMAEAKDFLKTMKWDGEAPLIILQPGAKDRFKLWPLTYFAEAAKRIYNDYPSNVKPLYIVTGSMHEARMVKGLAAQIEGAIPLFGQVSLRVLIAILKMATLVITNDTGTMHLAFSQSAPTVALFSPTDPDLCGPYLAKNTHIIGKKRSCNPCLRKRCADPFCMRQISIDEVVNLSLKILG